MEQPKQRLDVNFWAPVAITVVLLTMLLGWIFTFPW